MSEEKKLRQSYGQFEVTGTIEVTPGRSFETDLVSKNNASYIYSRLNLKFEDGNGKTFYLNAMDGYDKVQGKQIRAQIKDSENGEAMFVNFADRHNETILSQIDGGSLIGVAFDKTEDEEGKKKWNFKNFLAMYDVIEYLKSRLQTGMRLQVKGKTRYSEYNGDTQKEFQINTIKLIAEDEQEYSQAKKQMTPIQNNFTFRQDVIIQNGDVDLSEWDEKSIAKVKAKILTKVKKKYTLLNLPLVIRAKDGDEEDKKKRKLVIDKFLDVAEGTIRRIQLEGTYNTGYTSAKVSEEDLPEEAKEMIEMGLYDKEEVLQMYAKGDRVDEMLIVRPAFFAKKGEIPKVNLSDADYTVEDLKGINQSEPEISVPWDASEEVVEGEANDLSFLDDLD